jgi:hypothetical protein
MKLLEAVCFGGAIMFTCSFIIKNLAHIELKKRIPGQDSHSYIAMILWILWYYLSH